VSLADPPAGLPVRLAALRLLDAVLRQGLALEAALDRAAKGLAGPDRALAHAIAAGTIRYLPDLDRLIDRATLRPLPPDAKARAVLRLALAQLLLLKTPAHAVVATALPLVTGGPRRLVHAILSRVQREALALPAFPTLPIAVATRWQAQWGDAMVAAAAQAIAAPPPLDLTLRAASETELWAEQLAATIIAPGQLRLPAGVNVAELPGFAAGAWWVQDVAAAVPAQLLGPGDGRRVLDLCAAPGGKTLQLAAAGWQVTAVEQAPKRLKKLAENLARTQLTAELVCADALRFTAGAPYDAVLLDAPCSATGIFRRHPDVLYRAHPRLIAERAAEQVQLLAHAASLVKPGGRLVYAVCSLERAEGEEVIATMPGQWTEIQRRLPNSAAGDGFFIAAKDF
jgi:16S rRNA (cytosine967-C5)-methyltransferase